MPFKKKEVKSINATSNVYLFETQHRDGTVTKSPHPGQQAILNDPSRFKVVVCGRRFGKTMLSIIMCLLEALKGERRDVWYIAPTYKQAKMIAWRMLVDRLHLMGKQFVGKCKVNESYLQVTFPNGSTITLKGVDNPDDLRGAAVDFMVLDEYAHDNYARVPVWREILRPALSDRMGQAIFISTPKGYNHLYDLYELAEGGSQDGWKAWRMPSSMNPYLKREELLAARKEVGEDAYIQEYEAEFKKRQGLVYKEFSREIHVIDSMEPDFTNRPWNMEVGIDFGTAHPTAAVVVLFDHLHDVAYVVDEYTVPEESIHVHAGSLLALESRWLREPCVRWGDSRGAQEIMEFGKLGYAISSTPKGADSVGIGISEIRKRLYVDPLLGKPKLFVCRNCVNVIKEFENYRWKSSVSTLRKADDKPEKFDDDLMDALRYVIQYHRLDTGAPKKSNWQPLNPLTGV